MDIESAYQQALDYLYSFIDYSLTRNLRFSAGKFDLTRMEALMDRLGHPEREYAVIHVAGTKGKGSVSAFCASALRAAGYRTGFYSSPHLQEFTERIQFNGVEISKELLVELVEELKPHVAAIEKLTTFEITTALAFLYFSRAKAEIAVIEVGLGGRLDATNVVTPLLSVITSISMDHMNVLGNTLPKIAGEKAGIIKTGRPVIISPQKEEALRVIEKVARKKGARLVQAGREIRFAPRSHSLDSQSLWLWKAEEQQYADDYLEGKLSSTWQPIQLDIPLLGYHQLENAAVAYLALQAAVQEGLNIPPDAIRRGFAGVNWPGRFEILSRAPLLIVDSAHNRDSALKLRLAIDDYLPGKPVVLIFGASEDKDIPGMFAELLPRVERVIATQSVHPRAAGAEKLVELAHQFGVPAQAVMPLEAALSKALALAGPNTAVVAAGSLFVAAAVREVYKKMETMIQA